MESRYTLSLVTENDASALLRLTTALSRHRIHIESLTCTEAGPSDAYRHTVVVRADPDRVRRAFKQLCSTIGVLATECHAEGDTVDREVALYKLSVDASALGNSLTPILRTNRARLLVAGRDYVVVEKTGRRDEIEELFEALEPFGVMEFVRSGQVAVTRPQAGNGAHAAGIEQRAELEAPLRGANGG